MGLREQKKEATRRLIGDTAWRMFAEHGFDQVTVTQIARAAKVAPATVFNYFPTKEDLFYGPLLAFGERLVEAVRRRGPGESAVAAFERFLLASNTSLADVESDPESLRRLRSLSQVIAGSAALRDRERRAMDEYADALAAELCPDPADPAAAITARTAANAMLGTHRALIDLVRRRVLAGDVAGLAAEVAAATRSSVALLAGGLGDYARVDPAPS